MEEIIGLLVILAIGIFKAVSKKLENAGSQQPTETFEPVEEQTIPEHNVFIPRQGAYRKAKPSTIEIVTRQTAPKKPILEEPESEGPKEKIDPKKLVIYSEIMKPKFNE